MVTTAIYFLGSTSGTLRCSLCQVASADSQRGTQRSGFLPRFLLGRSGYFLTCQLDQLTWLCGFPPHPGAIGFEYSRITTAPDDRRKTTSLPAILRFPRPHSLPHPSFLTRNKSLAFADVAAAT